ncbi:MAG: PspC domain-containing protein [Mediterranea sp.]|jgi:phage shock protein PspC (stress-responsive transcriptional regulator)|nr:PspC domain-containing protein [Mediterranea sp.]
MKKTLTVNIGGTVFHMDEDAYFLLDEYLCNLKHHFRKQERADEIINGIETRISEQLSGKTGPNISVITITCVEEIIQRIGKPEEFENNQSSGDKHDTGNKKTNTCKRLYRNPDNKTLGGVISGLAAYLNCDVTLLRLLTLAILVCGVGTLVPVYLVCWLVIPEARTAAEKLNMRGEEVTIENIGKTVTDKFEKVADGLNDYIHSDKPHNLLQKTADALVTIAGLILKAALVVLAIIFSPLLFVLAIIFVVLAIVIISVMISGSAILYHMIPSVDWAYTSVSPLVPITACISGVIIVGIPLFGIIYSILRWVFNKQPMAAGLNWTLLILWFIATFTFILALSELNWTLPYQ